MLLPLYLTQSLPATAQTTASVVAVIDGTAISSVDLENKIRLLLLTTGKSDNAENAKLYRDEALEMLIDETLKIQAGRSLNPESLTQATTTARAFFENIYADEILSATERLQAAGIRASTALDQIKADIVWTGVLTQKFRRQFAQVDTLANAERTKILADLSAPQYKISEIVLMPIPSRPLAKTHELVEQLEKAISDGADFNAIAAQYSMSGSSKNGGNIGWVQAKKLPSDILQAIENTRLSEKNIVLLKSEDFSYIFRLEGYREFGFNDPRLDTVSMARAVLMLPPNISEEAKDAQISKLKAEAEKITSCDALRKYHLSLGSEVLGQINNIVIEKLENSFQQLVLGLKVEEASDVIQTADNELSVFMICSRVKEAPDIPSLEKLKEAEFNKLYSVLSLRYLMRLRRAASIEIKTE
jgi:peptidyl-prolyl cis-trans isomerase SurA